MLLYSLLHLTGYDLPIEQIKQFRQWGSHPGHPRAGPCARRGDHDRASRPGIRKWCGLGHCRDTWRPELNRPRLKIINHFTYAIVSDGDLMEGWPRKPLLWPDISLGKLIYLYDNNYVTLAARTNITYPEDRGEAVSGLWVTRPIGCGWKRSEGYRRGASISPERNREAIHLMVRTHLVYGSPHKQTPSKLMALLWVKRR